MGMNGPVALDYGVLPVVLRLCEVPRKEWPAVFEDIRTMEIETLNLIAQEHA